MIILLDGAKGAGKSSVAKILLEKIKNVVFLSFDNERKLLPERDKIVSGIHKEPFDKIIKKASEYLKLEKNLVIDCGLTKERVLDLEQLALNFNSKLYKFYLTAPYEFLLKRVSERDSAKGKKTDVDRFDEVYNIVHSKEFNNFNIIETDKLSQEEVADTISKIIGQKK